MKITGFFELSEAIPVMADCLDQAFEININGFEGKILMPKLSNNFFEKSEGYRDFLLQQECEINFGEGEDWGQPFSWPSGESYLSKFKIEIESPRSSILDDIKDDLLKETNRWIKRFEENLFVFGYHVGLPRIKEAGTYSKRFELYFKPDKESKPQRIISNNNHSVTVNIPNSIELNDFSKAIETASLNKNLCPEYKLLKDSQMALKTNEYRKSILDSATALELCLTNVLKRELIVENQDLLNKILKMNNSISKKRELLNILNINLPLPSPEYQDKVEGLRNKSIHAGIEISEEEAKIAYEIVAKTLGVLIIDKLI